MSFLHGTSEDVLRNRTHFLKKHGLALEDCIVMSVDHSNLIARATEQDRGRGAFSRENVREAEALITSTRNLVLLLLTADCFPVAFYDPVRHVIALAHLGWKPTNLRLAQKVVHEFETACGSDPNNLLIAFGPGILQESYIVNVATQTNSPEWRHYLQQTPDGKTAVDLVGYNIAQLLESGVPRENITVTDIDTAASAKHFSHYRETRTREQTGRLATILALR